MSICVLAKRDKLIDFFNCPFCKNLFLISGKKDKSLIDVSCFYCNNHYSVTLRSRSNHGL